MWMRHSQLGRKKNLELSKYSFMTLIQIENGLMSDILLNSLINEKANRVIKIVSKDFEDWRLYRYQKGYAFKYGYKNEVLKLHTKLINIP